MAWKTRHLRYAMRFEMGTTSAMPSAVRIVSNRAASGAVRNKKMCSLAVLEEKKPNNPDSFMWTERSHHRFLVSERPSNSGLETAASSRITGNFVSTESTIGTIVTSTIPAASTDTMGYSLFTNTAAAILLRATARGTGSLRIRAVTPGTGSLQVHGELGVYKSEL